MKKFISILLTLAMAISLCANVAFAADTQAGIVTKTQAAMKMATSDNVIYIDDSMDNDPTSVEAGQEGYIYSTRHFLGTGDQNYKFVGISYPPALKTENKVIGASNQAEINTAANTIKSNVTGVTYTLPAKITLSDANASDKFVNNLAFEGFVIDRGGWNGGAKNAQGAKVYTLPTADNYDKIHILIGRTKQFEELQSTTFGYDKNENSEYSTIGWTAAGAFWAIPKYSDDSTGLPDSSYYKAGGDARENYEPYVFKTAFLNSSDADGSKGMLGVIIPKDADITDETRQGFVAELEARYSNDTTPSTKDEINEKNGKTNPLGGKERFTADFSNAEANAAHSILLHEYTIDVDETKTLSSIHFGNQSSVNKQGIVILGVVGEKAVEIPTPFYKDLMNQNTSKLYVDPTDPAETTGVEYHKKNFLGRTKDAWDEFVAIQWPLERPTNTSYGLPSGEFMRGTITVEDNGTPTNKKDDISIVKSSGSGMEYRLTRDTTVGNGAKDAIILCTHRDTESMGHMLPSEATIPVHNAPYNTLSVLIASANQSSKDYDWMKIYANYTDGTTSIPDDYVEGNNCDGTKGYIEGNALINQFRTMLSPNGDYYKTGTAYYLGLVKTMWYKWNDADEGKWTLNPLSDETDWVSQNANGRMAYNYQALLADYQLTLDPEKTVESITVETWNTSPDEVASRDVRGIAILGVAGEQAVIANPADVAEDAVAIEAYTKVAGDVYAAVYEKSVDGEKTKLVAMGLAKNVAANKLTDVAVNNDAIAADGEYDIKLFVWATDGSFQPLAGTTNVNIAQ